MIVLIPQLPHLNHQLSPKGSRADGNPPQKSQNASGSSSELRTSLDHDAAIVWQGPLSPLPALWSLAVNNYVGSIWWYHVTASNNAVVRYVDYLSTVTIAAAHYFNLKSPICRIQNTR
jgi:hypothetical protein